MQVHIPLFYLSLLPRRVCQFGKSWAACSFLGARWFLFACVLLSLTNYALFGQSSNAVMAQAKQFIQKKEYAQSVQLLRNSKQGKRLGTSHAERAALLATSYVHMGAVLEAQNYLKIAKKSQQFQSLALYLEAWLFHVSAQTERRNQNLATACRIRDFYGEKSCIALITFYFKQEDVPSVMRISSFYRQHFPKGQFHKVMQAYAQRAQARLFTTEKLYQEELFLTSLAEARQQHSEQRLLNNFRHFYLIDLGYRMTFGEISQPAIDEKTRKPTITNREYNDFSLNLDLQLGLGPFEKNNTTTHTWYGYKQRWYSDSMRLMEFFSGSDGFMEYITYFPFRADLLERQHILGLHSAYQLSERFSLDLLVQLRFHFLGSDLIPGPEGDAIEQKSKFFKEARELRPRLKIHWSKDHQTQFTLVLRKEIMPLQEEFSFKTHSVLDLDTPLISFTLGHQSRIDRQWTLGGKLHYFQLIFNDFLSNYQATGFETNVAYSVSPQLSISADIGYLGKNFVFDKVSQSDCGKTFTDNTPVPSRCAREETFIFTQIGTTWNYKPHKALYATFSFYRKEDPGNLEFFGQFYEFLVGYSYEFPTWDYSKTHLQRTTGENLLLRNNY